MTAAAVKPTLAILVAISALQPIALNLLAPATPALARHFSSNYATIQLTLTLFLGHTIPVLAKMRYCIFEQISRFCTLIRIEQRE